MEPKKTEIGLNIKKNRLIATGVFHTEEDQHFKHDILI